jgi:hypothetical protein
MACIEEEKKRTIGEKERVARATAQILGKRQIVFRNKFGIYDFCSEEDFTKKKGVPIRVVDVPDDAV